MSESPLSQRGRDEGRAWSAFGLLAGGAEDRTGFRWELEEAFLWAVALGLVEAEKGQEQQDTHTSRGRTGRDHQPQPRAPPGTPDAIGCKGPLWTLALGPGRQKEQF